MIGDRKRVRLARHQHFAERTAADLQPTGLAKMAIDVNGPVDRNQSVFRDHDDFAADRFGSVDDSPRAPVDFGHASGVVIGQPLKVVIEVRQIGERELRLLFSHHDRGRIRNPLAARQALRRDPKRKRTGKARVGLSGRTRCDRECQTPSIRRIRSEVWAWRCIGPLPTG